MGRAINKSAKGRKYPLRRELKGHVGRPQKEAALLQRAVTFHITMRMFRSVMEKLEGRTLAEYMRQLVSHDLNDNVPQCVEDEEEIT